jgi:hypothetical protein
VLDVKEFVEELATRYAAVEIAVDPWRAAGLAEPNLAHPSAWHRFQHRGAARAGRGHGLLRTAHRLSSDTSSCCHTRGAVQRPPRRLSTILPAILVCG